MCMCGAWNMTGVAMFSVIEKSSGKWVGRLGPWYPEGWPDHEVGWGIVREHWGKGYASEGAAATMDYAFDVLGWTELIHCIEESNLASQGVAKRLGSRLLRRVQHARAVRAHARGCLGPDARAVEEKGVRHRFLANGARHRFLSLLFGRTRWFCRCYPLKRAS